MNRGVTYGVVLVSAVLFLFSAVPIVAGEGGPPPMPPARAVPGITADDMFPNACVDCHVIIPDMNLDVRLSTVMNQWTQQVDEKFLGKAQALAPKGMTLKGKHPAVGDSLRDVPAACLTCHTKGSKSAPPFANMMHAFHLSGGGQNPFMTIYQGECTHCHKLNQTTGVWSIPSAPEK